MTVSVKDAVRDRWRDAHTRWEAEGRRRGGLVFWDRLVEPITKSLVEQGINESWIQVGHHAMLPGAYGLGRSWDLTVVKDGVPLGAITLTSHNAPINNFNNRVRELTSTAFDVRRQYASPELHDLRPCLGFFFILILADSQQADAPASRPSGTYPKIGGGLPFQERYGKVSRQFRAEASTTASRTAPLPERERTPRSQSRSRTWPSTASSPTSRNGSFLLPGS